MCIGKVKKRLVPVIFEKLLETYGPQGWWPLVSRAGNPGFDERGYHRGNYAFPKSIGQRFEIALGAVLTQNTAWKNAEIALTRLFRMKLLSLSAFSKHSAEKLKKLIRPCGYFNQKARKILILASFLEKIKCRREGVTPSREELLALWGIGEETADSILLYAFGQPSFVVDAYTKRIFSRLGFFEQNSRYSDVKNLFTKSLPEDPAVYNEMHALIVAHAKAHCRKTPLCEGCTLREMCKIEG